MTKYISHPQQDDGIIWVAAFCCPGCDRFVRMGTDPACNEDGSVLYCRSCAPAEPYTVTLTTGEVRQHTRIRYRWCRRGGHVHVCDERNWRCKVSHAKTKQPVQRDPRPCQHCGEDFQPKRSDAKYCSGRCRVAAHRGALVS